MKIAIIFPRFTGPYGGERLVANYAKSMKKSGNSVVIYTHSAKQLPNELKNGLDIVEGIYPPIKNHDMSSLLDLLLMALLVFKINKHFDLLIPIGWQSVFAAYLYKKFRNNHQKIIYYCLEPPRIAYDLKNDNLQNASFFKKIILIPVIGLIKYIDKISVKSCDHIVSISDWTRNQVKKIYGQNSTVIQPGIEVDRFKHLSRYDARKRLYISKDKNVFLSVSKLHLRKRLDLAINIFEKKKKDNSVFYIIGDGPNREEIEYLMSKMGDKDIKLLGRVPDEQVSLYMKAANFFLFTAQNEPFGIAPLEAFLSGCVVIPNGIKYKPQSWKYTINKHISLYRKILYDN